MKREPRPGKLVHLGPLAEQRLKELAESREVSETDIIRLAIYELWRKDKPPAK